MPQSGSPIAFTSAFFRRAIGLARLVNPLSGAYANERHPAIRLLAQAFETSRPADRRMYVAPAALYEVWKVLPDGKYALAQNVSPSVVLSHDELPSWPFAWALVTERADRAPLAGDLALHFLISQSHPLWDRNGKRIATNVCGYGAAMRGIAKDADYAAITVEALLDVSRSMVENSPTPVAQRRISEAS